MFKQANFHVIKPDAKAKKAAHEKKEKKKKGVLGAMKQKLDEPKTVKIMPKYIQIEAALYLGCERISQFSYSKPQIFGQNA